MLEYQFLVSATHVIKLSIKYVLINHVSNKMNI